MSGYVSDRYNTRYMTMAMAAVAAFCHIVAYLAPNLDITIVCFALIGKEPARVS